MAFLQSIFGGQLSGLRRCNKVLVAALMLIGVAGCQTMTLAPPTGGNVAIAPANPAPDEQVLKPGLAVDYSNIIANKISDVETAGRGKPGTPLPHLNWPTAGGGAVMTSNYAIHVAARIEGYMKFPESGRYELRILSNDGVHMALGGITVLSDPGVHVSRLAGPTVVTITQTGWYKLEMQYFQKDGSATLELHWRRPGQADFEAVPGEMFAHTPI